MTNALIKNWKVYLIEAWALGMFMISASLFVILIEHPDLPFRTMIASPLIRRLLIGLAMGITAVLLIYSKWGKLSGAHMNPAVTLAFYQIDRINGYNAIWYILAQFTGGYIGVLLFKWMVPDLISHPSVNYVVTIPGSTGIWMALLLETLMAFAIFFMVLTASNHAKWANYTGYFVGIMLVIFITTEAPYSGMSINPARTIASALNAHFWPGWWLYFIGPVAGMMSAGFVFRKRYRHLHNGECLSMKCHLSGNNHGSPAYGVYGPLELITNLQKN